MVLSALRVTISIVLSEHFVHTKAFSVSPTSPNQEVLITDVFYSPQRFLQMRAQTSLL